ncbi:MAG: ABC transporter permease [Planctomycetota bacterium]|jgi:ABC-2 type transport system permease protein
MKIYLLYLKSERVTGLLFALFLLACAYVLVAIFPSIAKTMTLQDYIEAMPTYMKAFLGQEFIGVTTLEGFLTLEYFNTTWLLIMGVFSCLFAGAMVAEETEKKTLEILFSTPVTRTRFIISKFAGFLTLLVFLSAVSFLGIYLGELQIGQSIDKRLTVYVFFSGTICMATIGSIGLFLSCLFNEQRRATGSAITVFFLLYIFNLIALLLEQYPILKYFSLFQYYDASKIFKRQAMYWPDMAILIGVFSIMLGASIFTFRRKEIYL